MKPGRQRIGRGATVGARVVHGASPLGRTDMGIPPPSLPGCVMMTSPLLMVADGAMTGALFLKYVQEFLCPTLHPGDIVIADNVRRHQVAGVKEAMEAVGARLRSLPPYSPDRNPIEKLLATLNALLRNAATCTVDALWKDIGTLLDGFTPAECTRSSHPQAL